MAATRTTTRRGFTLVEMLIVIALLALLAGMTLPRLLGNQRRATTIAIEQTADLLTMLAHRDSMGAENLALSYDRASHALVLRRLATDPDLPNEPPAWYVDRFTSPVRLPSHVGLSVREDGRSLFGDDWLLPVSGGSDRPGIEIMLSSDDVEATVYLPAHALVATIIYSDDDVRDLRYPIELDERGVW